MIAPTKDQIERIKYSSTYMTSVTKTQILTIIDMWERMRTEHKNINEQTKSYTKSYYVVGEQQGWDGVTMNITAFNVEADSKYSAIQKVLNDHPNCIVTFITEV